MRQVGQHDATDGHLSGGLYLRLGSGGNPEHENLKQF